jgi:hypothetical protein
VKVVTLLGGCGGVWGASAAIAGTSPRMAVQASITLMVMAFMG